MEKPWDLGRVVVVQEFHTSSRDLDGNKLVLGLSLNALVLQLVYGLKPPYVWSQAAWILSTVFIQGSTQFYTWKFHSGKGKLPYTTLSNEFTHLALAILKARCVTSFSMDIYERQNVSDFSYSRYFIMCICCWFFDSIMEFGFWGRRHQRSRRVA